MMTFIGEIEKNNLTVAGIALVLVEQHPQFHQMSKMQELESYDEE